MCGMVGYSGVDNFDIDKIRILMLANMSRGMHSTGMYCKSVVSKDSLHASEFLALYDDELKPDTLFMGHDRHATIGDKGAAKNAHPFHYGDVIGQHNGTLTNHYFLSNDFNFKFSDFDVDSQVLIAALNADKEDYSALYQFEGAAALIWHDETIPDRLYCFRNSERPLWRGYCGTGMYISSIPSALEIIGCKSIREFKTNYLYIINKGVIDVKHSKSIVRKKKKVRKFKKDTQNHNHNHGTHENLKNVCAYHRLPNDDDNEYDDMYHTDTIQKRDTDDTCDWVRRTASSVHNLFTKDKWYRIYGVTKDGVYEMMDDLGRQVTSMPDNFSSRQSLHVGHWVIVPKFDKGGLFSAGEVLYLRGLELSEKYIGLTDAVIEKIPHDGHTYTWNKASIRNATADEIKIIVNENQKTEKGGGFVGQKDLFDTESKDEYVDNEMLRRMDFEENVAHLDGDGNQLGSLVMEVGSTYQSLKSIQEQIVKIDGDLDELTDLEDVDNYVRLAIEFTRERLNQTLSLTRAEVTNLFNDLYDEYGEEKAKED